MKAVSVKCAGEQPYSQLARGIPVGLFSLVFKKARFESNRRWGRRERDIRVFISVYSMHTVVFDVNVLVSSLIPRGKPRKLRLEARRNDSF
ncbi:MAG: hypothetical protein FGF48_10230 [Candidatus Brockarchaeota archaeon]|nr:hypothetical protein [Candidatus Brockarchaeota archaeon]